jgi:tyrosinase
VPAFTRRAFLKGIAAVPLVYGLPRAKATTTLVRYDLASEQGARMLEIYAQAIAQMQSRSEDSPLGWMWQWYTHFVSGATTKSDEIDRIFGAEASQQRSLAEETWNTCQSHAGQNANHFLPWHRMFVHYFERIVREVSAHPEFTLPYWDYTSGDPAKRGVVPEQFRLPGDALYGSLYRATRTTLANAGEPIQQNQPADVMDISDAMSRADYLTVDGVQGFCRAIDSGIHGRIHTLVGTAKGMGSVPFAGNDPLFWVHHANIDRMWASWNYNGGKNPTDSTLHPWIDTAFVMVDADGSRVSRPLKDFFGITALGYTYDRFIPKPSQQPSRGYTFPSPKTTWRTPAGDLSLPGNRKTAATPTPNQRVASATTTANLGGKPTRVALRAVSADSSGDTSTVLGLDPRRQKRTYLVLKDLHAWKQPEVLFHVYVLPMRGGKPGRTHYAGNINFFDAEFHDHGRGMKADALGENFYSFDVTDVLRRIEAAGGSRDGLQVLIVPAGTPTAGAGAMVAAIDLIQR